MLIGPSGTSQNVTISLKVVADPSNASVLSKLNADAAKAYTNIGGAAAKAAKSSTESMGAAASTIGNNGAAVAARWDKAMERLSSSSIKAHRDAEKASAKAAAKQVADAERAASQQITAAKRLQREEATRERLLLRSEVRQDAMAHKFVHGAMDMGIAAAGVAKGVAEIGMASEESTERIAQMFVKFQGVFDLVEHGMHLLWGMNEAMLTLKRLSQAVAQEETLRAAATAAANAANLIPRGSPSRGMRLAENAVIPLAAAPAARGIVPFFTNIGPKMATAAAGIGRLASGAAYYFAIALGIYEAGTATLRYLGIVNKYTESMVGATMRWWKASEESAEATKRTAKMEKARADRLAIAERMTSREKLLGDIGGSFRSEQRNAAVRAGREADFDAGELARARSGVVDAQRAMATAQSNGTVTPDEKLAQALERLKTAQDHILEAKEKEVQLAKQAVEEEKKRLDDITLTYAKLPKGDRATIEAIGLRGGPKNEREARYLEGVGLGKSAAMENYWRSQVTGQEQKALGNIFGLKNTPLEANLAERQREQAEVDRARMNTILQIQTQKGERGGVAWSPETSADTPGATVTSSAKEHTRQTDEVVNGIHEIVKNQQRLAGEVNRAVRQLNNGWNGGL